MSRVAPKPCSPPSARVAPYPSPGARGRAAFVVAAGVLIGSAVASSGCGYVLGSTGHADGRGAGLLAELSASHVLEVVPFGSSTAEGGVVPLATRAARERLALRMLPVAPAEAPRLAVGGEVLEVEATPVAFDAALLPTLWRVRVKVRVDVTDGVRVRGTATVESAVETPGGDVQATEAARRLALVRALEGAIDGAYGRLAPP